ncbi:MAG: 16S rRNA (adenine(1518)-N(6)/adenine(1519)-N(6))-dimethyltransferase RsmA [Bacteroidota bacterium]
MLVLRNHFFTPKKRLGQHFLIDANIARKIVAAIPARADATIVEIGPGRGALTRHLLSRFNRVIAIELDERSIAFLNEVFRNECKLGNLVLRHQDVREVDFALIRNEVSAPLHIVGNLPYYLSGAILSLFLDQRSMITSATVMLQREVAQRLVAKPRTKAYGILSVLFQALTNPTILFNVSPHAFKPAPKVRSAVVQIEFLTQPKVYLLDVPSFFFVVRTLFAKRRKMLRNSVADLLSKAAFSGAPTFEEATFGQIFDRLAIDPQQRPEELTVADFAKITNYFVSAVAMEHAEG